MTTTINASTSSGLVTTPDNSGDIALQSNGTTKLTVASTGAYGQLVSGTAQASTSGTSIDFTGLPSWVKRITVMFSGVSTNGANGYIIQIGSGSFVTTGYSSGGSYQGAASAATTITTGFLTVYSPAPSTVVNGHAVLTNITGNTWVSSAVLTRANENYTQIGGGSITLGGVLDRVRITTFGGTDAFDAGTINILYEG